jgi:hypothetical protein
MLFEKTEKGLQKSSKKISTQKDGDENVEVRHQA